MLLPHANLLIEIKKLRFRAASEQRLQVGFHKFLQCLLRKPKFRAVNIQQMHNFLDDPEDVNMAA